MTEEIKQEKTEQEIYQERLERYQKDPNSFVEVKDLICAAIHSNRSGLGVAIMVGNAPRGILGIAQSELNHAIEKNRIRMDVAGEMRKIQPPGAMRSFANKIMGK